MPSKKLDDKLTGNNSSRSVNHSDARCWKSSCALLLVLLFIVVVVAWLFYGDDIQANGGNNDYAVRKEELEALIHAGAMSERVQSSSEDDDRASEKRKILILAIYSHFTPFRGVVGLCSYRRQLECSKLL